MVKSSNRRRPNNIKVVLYKHKLYKHKKSRRRSSSKNYNINIVIDLIIWITSVINIISTMVGIYETDGIIGKTIIL